MSRICFLFNHDQTHQLAHSLPIAMALAARAEHRIVLAYTKPAIRAEIERQADPALLAKVELVHLTLKRSGSQALANLLERLVPANKLLIYRDNLDFFASFDAVVVSEKTSLLLKTLYGLENVKLVHTRHGAGDRAIGFNKESAGFDLVLVAGPKIRDRLIAEAGLTTEQIALVGYPKFDLCAGNRFVDAFPAPDRPTVLYNPHPSPALSSWFKHGAAVLEAFRNQDRYNLIFAPHVMLFERKWVVTVDPPSLARVVPPSPKLRAEPRIHVDTGSAASSDMSYTNRADIYIGDVSSQVYEFMHTPRPCLFLNAHGVDWQGDPNYLHWRAGPVLESADGLLDAIDAAVASHPEYAATQQALIDATFSLSERASAERAADAIGAFLERKAPLG
ncbi:CDP-glycerol glycerophosphotransferase family protein [Porphyrobacter sp. ULC335]|uniref:CDP-glycerol glycerophosphotransferase family protein n=1 Tax=Porphyrobacter sp. ULC335 TaxID=2854260 RepID=UPI00221F1A9D|nr:CDP-glycerol glycerophosphotransferase family protein [Porphyrobacter sp. ULC335]UYV15217.1 CDP-glycerol glycerophosphotransferase family protein [Porphyrobacter sp. ULC335]